MAMNLPHPKFLSTDELNYELVLRGREQDMNLQDEQKVEILRKLFQEDQMRKVSIELHTYSTKKRTLLIRR